MEHSSHGCEKCLFHLVHRRRSIHRISAREETQVYKLKKDLYGLKQGPSAWYVKIYRYFPEGGLEGSKSELALSINKKVMMFLFQVCMLAICYIWAVVLS